MLELRRGQHVVEGGLQIPGLTLMIGLYNQFSDHGLDDTYVPVQGTTQESAQESEPEVGSKADDQEGEGGAQATEQQDGLPSNAIREGSPGHACASLGE